GGRERRRHDDARAGAAAAVRSRGGAHPAGWPRAQGVRRRVAAPGHRRDLPGLRRVRHGRAREHRGRPDRGAGGPGADRAGGGQESGGHGDREAGEALRPHAGPALRRRREPLGRRVAEDRAGARVHAGRRGADPGRADGGAGRARGVRGVPALQRADGRAHGRADQPPVLDGADGGPHPGAGERRRARGGHARGAAGARRAVRGAVRVAGGGVPVGLAGGLWPPARLGSALPSVALGSAAAKRRLGSGGPVGPPGRRGLRPLGSAAPAAPLEVPCPAPRRVHDCTASSRSEMDPGGDSPKRIHCEIPLAACRGGDLGGAELYLTLRPFRAPRPGEPATSGYSVARVDATSDEITALAPLPDTPPLPPGARPGGVVHFQSRAVWAVLGSGLIVTGRTDQGTFRVYGQDGVLVREIRLPLVARPVRDADRAEIVAEWQSFAGSLRYGVRDLVMYPEYDVF